jgi:hypothetical protein
MSSNESIFTTEPFPTRADRQASKQHKRIIKRTVIGVVAAAVGFAMGTGIVALTTPEADAGSRTAINKFIRANGGIPPCKWEDGSGQPGMCYWNDGSGDAIVLVPTKPGKDKRVVVLINR